MKLVTRDTDYAVRALLFIANADRKVISVRYIVKELKIPGPFLRKVLQILNKKGIIESQKGKGGGFMLARATGKIFLTEIMEIFQGPISLNECLFKKKPCPEKNLCVLNKKIREMESYVINKLKAITIESLCERKGGGHGKKKHH